MIEESDLETDIETKSRKRKKFIHSRNNSKIARSCISATNNSVTNTKPSTCKSPDTSSEFFECNTTDSRQ